jgi:hypothetical protein
MQFSGIIIMRLGRHLKSIMSGRDDFPIIVLVIGSRIDDKPNFHRHG